MKKRLGRSPDWADALALAVFSPPQLVEDIEPAILIRHSR
jgi:hypothetical protein